MLSLNRSQLAPCVGGAPCTPVALHRPWWRRWPDALHAVQARWARRVRGVPPVAHDPETWRNRDLLSLRGLSPGTLRDIGAPAWVRDAAYRDRQPPASHRVDW